MNVHICTISFRHSLQSIGDIAEWAVKHDFQGVELWGVHAAQLHGEKNDGKEALDKLGLCVPMVSGYIPLDQEWISAQQVCMQLSHSADRWESKKVRTFAGTKSSQMTEKNERRHVTEQLRKVCRFFEQNGQKVLIETHPGTLADSLPSTLQLLEEVNHPNLWVNFDVLHVWESGADPVKAYEQLAGRTAHFHLKNIASEKDLSVFQPDNVYSPSGSRKGMTPLFDGAVDYKTFLRHVPHTADVSLEWFGPDVKNVLESDRRKVAAFQHLFA